MPKEFLHLWFAKAALPHKGPQCRIRAYPVRIVCPFSDAFQIGISVPFLQQRMLRQKQGSCKPVTPSLYIVMIVHGSSEPFCSE